MESLLDLHYRYFIQGLASLQALTTLRMALVGRECLQQQAIV
jgi:hypothetical protein